MPLPQPNGHDAKPANEGSVSRERGTNLAELINEAEELRNLMQDAAARLSRLLPGLKFNLRQSRAVRAAMHSLRQIKLAD